MNLRLRKATGTLLAGGLLLAWASGMGWALAKSGTFVQEMQTTAGSTDERAVIGVAFKGNKSRFEVSRKGSPTLFVLTPGDTTYVYEASLNRAYKTKPSDGAPKTISAMAADAAKQVKAAKKTGSEKYLGRTCGIYEEKRPRGVKIQYWLSTDPEFPLILQKITTMPVGSQGDQMMTRLRLVSIRLGTKYDDAVFSLPKGVKIVSPPVKEPRVHQPLRGGRTR